MTRFRGILAAILLLLLSSVAAAQLNVEDADYFFAVDIPKGPSTWGSQVFISNPNEEDADVITFFSPLNNKAAGAIQTTTTIPAGQRIFMSQAAPAGKIGMMGLLSESQLFYQAVIGVEPKVSPRTGASHVDLGDDFDELTVYDATMAFSGGTAADIEAPYGLSEIVVTNFGLVPNPCTATVFDSSNIEVGTRSMRIRPVSIKRFKGVKALLAGTADGHGRVKVECDQPFYPEAFSWTLDKRNVASMGPQPGLVPPPSAGCELSVSFCRIIAGLVHQPQSKPNTWVKTINFAPPAGSYSKLVVHFDAVNTGWSGFSAGLHNLAWMGQNGKNRDMPMYLNVKGPSKSSFLMRHGYGNAAHEKTRDTPPWVMVPNVKYHFRYSYDTRLKLVELQVTRGAKLDLQILSKPNINNINVGAGGFFRLDLGFTGEEGAEPPSRSKAGVGWQWFNVSFELGTSGTEI